MRVCMCACVCEYLNVFLYVSLYACMCLCAKVCSFVCMFGCVSVCTPSQQLPMKTSGAATPTPTHPRTNTHMRVDICAITYIYLQTQKWRDKHSCVACCGVLQCVAVCCSVLQYVADRMHRQTLGAMRLCCSGKLQTNIALWSVAECGSSCSVWRVL